MERIGQYRVLEHLGEGGMGVVFAAEEVLTGRRVALKLMRREVAGSARDRKRFINEAALLSQLGHPNIVRCLACLEHEGQLAIVMEYLEGQTLRAYLDSHGPVGFAQLYPWARQLCAGLGHAHEGADSIAHRDLKPENIMLLPDGQLKIMDFGIAKVAGGGTQTVTAAGTLRYMSPEQVDAQSVDTRSDIYSLGLVLYELLSGAPPFVQDSPRQLLNAICTQPPPELADATRRQLPPGVEPLLLQMMAKRPEDRPQSVGEVAAALDAMARGEAWSKQPVSPAAPATVAVQPAVTRAGSARTLWAVVITAAAVVAGGALALISSATPEVTSSAPPAAGEVAAAAVVPTTQPGPPASPAAGKPKPLAAATTTPKLAASGPPDAGAGAAPSPNKPPTLEDHYLGPHSLGVNRVTDGRRSGKVQVTRKDGKLFMSGSVRRGKHHLSLSGFVTPRSKREFVLDGMISGVPDLSWRDVPPTPVSTRARFTFRVKGSRPYWRLYLVNGKDCVCNDNCGNDFCYIDVGL